MSIKDYSVGQWVVVMSSPGVPCQCNSVNSPDHPCRVLIEKVGRTKVHGRMSGCKNPVPMTIASLPDAKGLIAYPIQEAKRLYREALERRGFYAPDRVDQLVEAL